MTTFITEFVNASAKPIVLSDELMMENFSIAAGGDENPRWEVATRRQAIRGVGRAEADWIWDDGARNIMILRAGRERPEVLACVSGAGVCGLALTYDDLGEIRAIQSAAAQSRAAELAF